MGEGGGCVCSGLGKKEKSSMYKVKLLCHNFDQVFKFLQLMRTWDDAETSSTYRTTSLESLVDRLAHLV